MYVNVKWSYTGHNEDSLQFCRVLYAYIHPKSNKILYIGKADYCTVRERLRGSHKEAIFAAIVDELELSILHAIVGLLHIPSNRRFSSELLTDVESLLIMKVQPPYNRQSRQSRISRPSLAVKCTGDWPHNVT